ncbi:DUF4261 domain-containing protein [Gloeobacter kilaueensis]|uniref:DUF4261 domain-containing protein n=1 Tax=Gloeobacter kilaueensis (strain ATCC BAA-2537 / CCAP 1431/1 / ULC 316 / JS1) TaxID=1183438 RepID=U5QGN7_GLOK1|nr:DUF4261 domain-containing protein [Gloeobacter kilaueensis]AGY58048.1 hypothetical protein GKIL_1802 [Gloeobacter kilaueensis JS1]
MESHPSDGPVEIVLGIPGHWPEPDAIGQAILSQSERLFFAGSMLIDSGTDSTLQLDVADHDPQLQRAFELSASTPHDPQLLKAIGSHTYALYLIGAGGSLDAAQNMMSTAIELLDAGGLAVKVESSGLSHSAERWRELAERRGVLALLESYVTLVRSEEQFYTCGMHNLGVRDLAIPGHLSPEQAAIALQGFSQYLLLQNPSLSDGDTFSPGPQFPTYRLVAEPCTLYPEGDLLYNPFGWWRLLPA